MDEKGNESNAHWWSRLNGANTLDPYLRIAEKLGIYMPRKINESFEYDPNAPIPIRSPCHADFQHEAWFTYLRDTKTFPRDPKSKYIVAYSERKPIVFYQPYDTDVNITRARDRIAEYLAINNLSLEPYICDSDLLPLVSHNDYSAKWDDWRTIIKDYSQMTSGTKRVLSTPRISHPRRVRIQENYEQDDDWYSLSPIVTLRDTSMNPMVSWSEDCDGPRMKTRSILRHRDESPNGCYYDDSDALDEPSLLESASEVDAESDDELYKRYNAWCKKK